MKVSYLKTSWPALLLALFFFVMACYYAFQPYPDTSTVAGLDLYVENAISTIFHFINSLIWFGWSFVCYYEDCLRELNKRVEALEKELKEVKK